MTDHQERPDIEPEDPPETGEEDGPQAVEITIRMEPNGDLAINAPLSDPVLCFGLLEVAKVRLISRLTMSEMAQASLAMERQAKVAALVSPDGKPLTS